MKLDLKERISTVNVNLGDNDASFKHSLVLGHVKERDMVTKATAKSAELFESAIRCLMASACNAFLLLLFFRRVVNWDTDLCRLSTISSIGLDHFTAFKLVE